MNNEGRTQLQDIFASRRNVNRALRQIALMRHDGLESPLAEIKTSLNRIEQSVKPFGASDYTIKEC